MQSPQVAGTGVLQTSPDALEDDLDLAAVDEILSQHSSHTPVSTSMRGQRESAPHTAQQLSSNAAVTACGASSAAVTACGASSAAVTACGASIAHSMSPAIDLTGDQPQHLVTESQGSQPDKLVDSKGMRALEHDAPAQLDAQLNGQRASSVSKSSRYKSSLYEP